MKKDIQNRKDLEKLIELFYGIVKEDKAIGFYFTEVMKVKWEHHLPTMLNFWENLVFHQNDYKGNPMSIHKTINKKHKMKASDFTRWTKLFNKCVDELFEGENAEKIKFRAGRIARIMSDSLFKTKKSIE